MREATTNRAAVPQEHWPDLDGFRSSLDKKWSDEVGDCRQELVFIGIGMDEIDIYDSLQECLLTDEEFAMGAEAWQQFPDPFPAWNVSVDQALAAQAAM